MSLAERAREAVRAEPFVHEALRAGIVNYSAAARHLDVDGEEEAIATALARYAEELDPPNAPETAPQVRMRRNVALDEGDSSEEPLLTVGSAALVDGGDLTAIVATGEVGTAELVATLARLQVESVDLRAAGATEGTIVAVVGPRAGADALRLVEDALERPSFRPGA